MVWQQGINSGQMWQMLGCPRPYDNNAEKAEMIRNGQCSNANPDGSIKDPNARADTRAEWQRLGCPHDYESDAEKEAMINKGLCRTP